MWARLDPVAARLAGAQLQVDGVRRGGPEAVEVRVDGDVLDGALEDGGVAPGGDDAPVGVVVRGGCGGQDGSGEPPGEGVPVAGVGEVVGGEGDEGGADADGGGGERREVGGEGEHGVLAVVLFGHGVDEGCHDCA